MSKYKPWNERKQCGGLLWRKFVAGFEKNPPWTTHCKMASFSIFSEVDGRFRLNFECRNSIHETLEQAMQAAIPRWIKAAKETLLELEKRKVRR